MANLHFKDKWVLVTGASSGLGYEMAQQLALNHKANLIITARRAGKLNHLKEELEKQAGVQVKVIVADLSVEKELDVLINTVLGNYDIYGIILNAGVTYFGKHIELAEKDFYQLLNTNIISVSRMTAAFVKHFETTKKEGGIMIVSSMAAIFPVPYQAVYSATKSFLMTLANAMAVEITNKDFSITVFAPGGIATEMTDTTAFKDLSNWLMPATFAAKEAIYALQTRKYNYIPGWLNRVGSKFIRLLPRKFIIQRLGKMYGRSLNKQ